jgi:hypothetical protein
MNSSVPRYNTIRAVVIWVGQRGTVTTVTHEGRAVTTVTHEGWLKLKNAEGLRLNRRTTVICFLLGGEVGQL